MDTDAVAITGIGLASPLGSTPQEIWQTLAGDQPWTQTCDATRFAPFVYHPERAFDAGVLVEKTSLLRAMGRAQLYGIHAAGLALESAGLRRDPKRLESTDLIVACSAGDNDEAVDRDILRAALADRARGAVLNDGFMSLRPSLFLNQLPNLFAANISICHGVTGTSVTFIGDEIAGINALHTAFDQVASGQSARVLVGGIAEGGRRHFLEAFAAREALLAGAYSEIGERDEQCNCFGNGAGFVVLESAAAARERGAKLRCLLTDIDFSYAPRERVSAAWRTDQLLREMPNQSAHAGHVLTASHLAGAGLDEEAGYWHARHKRYQNLSNICGGLLEAALPVTLAVGALCVERRRYLPPVSSHYQTAPADAELDRLLVGCWGRSRGEGLALLETAVGGGA
jgi:3-oxoacyl-[acyl-carrier-protein] synthase II